MWEPPRSTPDAARRDSCNSLHPHPPRSSAATEDHRADECEPDANGGAPPIALRHRLSRQSRDLRQVVGLRLVQQEKERVQRADFGRLFPFRHAVELRLRLAARFQFSEAMTGTLLQLLDVAELDRCRRA